MRNDRIPPSPSPVVVVEPEEDEVEVTTYEIDELPPGPVKPTTKDWDDTERDKSKPGPIGHVVRVKTKGDTPQPVKVTIRHKPSEVPPGYGDKLRPHVVDRNTGSRDRTTGPTPTTRSSRRSRRR